MPSDPRTTDYSDAALWPGQHIPPDVPTRGPKGWRRYKQHPVDADGWTDWIRPAQGYRMGCCDCGLVHELEFRISGDVVEFRARRNARATAAKRRHLP